ncbi:MAG: thiolase family protein [Planctomycetota bacterium]|jgi:acetyl-CoA acetyltransferase
MSAHVVGTYSTTFKKWPDRDFRDLSREAVLGALSDAGFDADRLAEAPVAVGAVFFGNCAMDAWGQSNIRGQVALNPLCREGVLPERVPITNVEGGCATGALALQGALRAVRAGDCDLALAVGVEKTLIPDDPVKTFKLFASGIDQRHPEEWQQFFTEQAAAVGQTFAPDPRRIIFLDVHAMQAKRHMERFGTTAEHLAHVASKNHHHGSLNPKAQYRFEVSVADALADKPAAPPLTRAMCAPISDGAAAVLVASDRWLSENTAARERAVRVRSCAVAGGAWRSIDAPGVARAAAERAFDAAGLTPADVQIAEVHDATAFCEIHHLEMLGLCPEGEGGAYAASGATALGGERPVNLSGGLESKGHPLGATGLGMIDELVAQLRGEAGDRQAPGDPSIALAHNAGGAIGFDEALCAVTLLERAR